MRGLDPYLFCYARNQMRYQDPLLHSKREEGAMLSALRSRHCHLMVIRDSTQGTQFSRRRPGTAAKSLSVVSSVKS